MEMTAALAQLSSGKGEEMAEARVRNWGARGGPFISALGVEGGREVVSTGELTTTGMVAHSGEDGMARGDRATGWLGQMQGAKPSR
jgi:hypothetical protein